MDHKTSTRRLQDTTRTRATLRVGDLLVDDDFFAYSKQESNHHEGFAKTIRDRGLHLPIIVIHRDHQLYIVDGRFRVDTIIDEYGEDHEVEVEVIEEDLTLEEIQWLIADLGKTRKLRYQDLVNLYFLYHGLIPNRQGQHDVDENRHKVIARHIGISTSQLSKLLRINRVDPTQIMELDRGVSMKTVMNAIKKMEEVEEAKRKAEAEQEQENTIKLHNSHHKDRVVDMDAVPERCECCKRFYDTKWQEIPSIFDEGRDETNSQTDWLADE